MRPHRSNVRSFRILPVLAMVLAGWLATSTPAAGEGNLQISLSLDPSAGPPGTSTRVSGNGWPAGAPGRVHWRDLSGDVLGTFTTKANGSFSTTVTIPQDAHEGGRRLWVCVSPQAAPQECHSVTFVVTPPATPTRPPTATPAPTACDVRGGAGEVVIDFEGLTPGEELRGTTLPEGVRFIGDSDMEVFTPSVETRSGSKALSIAYWYEFGSAGIPLRIGFDTLQDFVGVFVGLNERIWTTDPVTATLTAYGLDEAGNRVVAGSDRVSFGPEATPIKECLSVAASRIFEITIDYGHTAEPEVIDDLVMRGPAVPVPVPGDDQGPEVTILLPEEFAVSADGTVRLQGEVREDRELARMNYQLRPGVFHELGFTPAGTTPEGDRLYLFAVDPLPVSELTMCGANTVQVRAYDSSDNIGGSDRTFRVMSGDLSIRQAEPVQVVYGADLVQGKSTAFRVQVDSTFDCPVDVMFRLELPEDEWDTLPPTSGHRLTGVPAGWEYPELWGPVTIPARATGHSVILPYIAPGMEGLEFAPSFPAGLILNLPAGGVEGPDVRAVPRPRVGRPTFAVAIDPSNLIPESEEANNRWTSPEYRAIVTRPMCFLVVPVRDGGTGPRASILNIKSQVEFLLATYPLADSKVTWMTASTHALACASDRSEDCSWSLYWNDETNAYAATMARASGCDYAIVIGPWGAGGQSFGEGGTTIGTGGWDALLAHEFNHSTTGLGDVYSLDCLVEWDEFYCEYADGHREYYCQNDNPRLPDGFTGTNCRLEAGAIVCEEQTKQCEMYTGCSPYGRTEACAAPGVTTCDRSCAEATVVPLCAGSIGYWSGPDCRIFHPSAEGFWVNRWQAKDSTIPYIADCGTATMWMRLENTGNHCRPGEEYADGYRNLLLSPVFVTGDDPEALLVRGVIYQSGQAELQPFIYLPESNLDRAPGAPGAYRVALYDAQGSLLSQTGFDLAFVTYGPNGGPTDHAPFVLRIEWKPGTQRVALEDAAGRSLADTLVTAHAPRIEVTSPGGGESWFAGNHTLRWTASDEDGDALTYFVDVSPDGGETWLPVAIDLKETEYSFDTSSYEIGTAYLVRVRASDGVNTTGDLSDGTFTVQAKRALPGGFLLIGGLALLGVVGVALLLWGLFFRKSRRG